MDGRFNSFYGGKTSTSEGGGSERCAVTPQDSRPLIRNAPRQRPGTSSFGLDLNQLLELCMEFIIEEKYYGKERTGLSPGYREHFNGGFLN